MVTPHHFQAFQRLTRTLCPGGRVTTLPMGSVAVAGQFAAGTPLHTPTRWYDPCAYSIPPAGFIGTEPRNALVGPGVVNLDFAIVKDTKVSKLGEGGAVEFRSEFFNVLNHYELRTAGCDACDRHLWGVAFCLSDWSLATPVFHGRSHYSYEWKRAPDSICLEAYVLKVIYRRLPDRSFWVVPEPVRQRMA